MNRLVKTILTNANLKPMSTHRKTVSVNPGANMEASRPNIVRHQYKNTTTAKDYRLNVAKLAGPRGRKPSKFRAKKTAIDGITFDSKKEAARYVELKRLQEAGDVLWFHMQVPMILWGTDKGDGKPERYRVDFQVFWSDGRVSYEDVKGMQTRQFKRKKKIVERLYPITIELK